MSIEAVPQAPARAASSPRDGDSRRRVAVFAPHLVTPIRNGGDLYIWRKWGALDPARHAVQLFAGDGVYESASGAWVRTDGPGGAPTLRSKARAAAHALRSGSDYLSSRFITPAYLARVRRHLAAPPELAVYSFACTWLQVAPLVDDARASLLETHNFEPKFYLDRAREAQGPARLAASVAAARAHALLARLPRELPLVALGQSDAEMFRAHGHATVLLSALGYDPEPPRTRFAPQGPIRIAFVGSLSIWMNVAAIREFAAGALPALRQALGAPLQVLVAGSRPAPALVATLRGHGIEVHADPGDAELGELLDGCHATIQPFDSSNGLKLKFATSAARGVPILGYIAPPPELAGATSILTSRDMREWAAFLRRLAAQDAQARAARELQGIVRGRTWRACAEANLKALDAARA